jgi:hypothetical protein
VACVGERLSSKPPCDPVLWQKGGLARWRVSMTERRKRCIGRLRGFLYVVEWRAGAWTGGPEARLMVSTGVDADAV